MLVGNHELHYYDDEFQASRFSDDYYDRYHKILTDKETAGLFQVCKQIENYLFIHAGITKQWYEKHEDELRVSGNNLETQINNLFVQNKNAFAEISYYRGGYSNAGSPLWTDMQELIDEPQPFSSTIIQIIGHTQIRDENPIINKNFILLDNRQLYLLKNNTITKYA